MLCCAIDAFAEIMFDLKQQGFFEASRKPIEVTSLADQFDVEFPWSFTVGIGKVIVARIGKGKGGDSLRKTGGGEQLSDVPTIDVFGDVNSAKL